MEFHRILVPVIGAEADEEAIKLACRLAKQDKSEVYAVYIITMVRELPLDAEVESEIRKAEDMLNHIESLAEEQGCRIETDLLQARDAGPAIIDEAIEREVDLILMGAAYKRRFGEFSLGEVLPHVLKNAPCCVILYHQYAELTSTEDDQ
ncbi:MAG: universal stress protein [Dehalococcoidales bacterium]|nr:universal stress protein [Dehalococcoidales bacterium]